MGGARRAAAPVDRRQALRLVAVVGATMTTAACSAVAPTVDRLGELVGVGDREPSPAPAPTPASRPGAPDVRLAVEVALLSETAAVALEAWAADGRGSRTLRRLAGEAASTHAAHAALVASAVPPRAEPGRGRLAPDLVAAVQGPLGTLPSVVRIEELAGSGLRFASLEARSGPFASLLAAMVASSAQHSALLRGADGSRS